MEVDRRSSPRVPYYTHAIIIIQDEQFPCRTLDLSARGVSLVSHARLEPGRLVEVELLLDSGGQWISLPGQLVRVERLNGLYFWGIHFDEQDEKVRLLDPLLDPGEDPVQEIAC